MCIKRSAKIDLKANRTEPDERVYKERLEQEISVIKDMEFSKRDRRLNCAISMGSVQHVFIS